MYLHAGNNKNIRSKNIIGIFDTDTATVSPITRKYLSAAEKRHEVEAAAEEIPKSFVLYSVSTADGKKRDRICFSQLSAASLRNRAENLTLR